jgi:cytochrome c553
MQLADRRSLLRGAALAASLALSVVAELRSAAAGDVMAGRQKADKCAACHGLDGLAKIAEAANIAGQNEQYLLAQLAAFRNGERKNEMMSIVIQDLSPGDIDDLAAYYSAIEISVGKIPGQ